MADYDSLIRAYPMPEFDRPIMHPRQSFDMDPSERGTDWGMGRETDMPRFRTLADDAPDASQMRRGQMPPSHHMPDPNRRGVYVAPYQHAMKRPGNAARMKEIFGEQQIYSSMDTLDLAEPQPRPREEFREGPTEQPYTGYVPRMKVLDESNVRVAPVREGYSTTPSQPNAPAAAHRVKVYNAILEYFPGFIMTKTGQHGPFGVWKAPAQCLLCNGVRYVVAIVKEDAAGIGEQRPLASLGWDSFQTRWTDDDIECRKFQMSTFPYGRPDQGSMLDDTIRLSRETKSAFKYQCDNLPLAVELIKLREDEHMAETGTVASALETFQCVLSWAE